MTAKILEFKRPEKKVAEPKQHKDYWDFYNHFSSYRQTVENWKFHGQGLDNYHQTYINEELKDK